MNTLILTRTIPRLKMGKYCYFSTELWPSTDAKIVILLNIWLHTVLLPVVVGYHAASAVVPKNRICHFMKIVSIGNDLHEMSNFIFWDKYIHVDIFKSFVL